jgi:hypothetical protein
MFSAFHDVLLPHGGHQSQFPNHHRKIQDPRKEAWVTEYLVCFVWLFVSLLLSLFRFSSMHKTLGMTQSLSLAYEDACDAYFLDSLEKAPRINTKAARDAWW